MLENIQTDKEIRKKISTLIKNDDLNNNKIDTLIKILNTRTKYFIKKCYEVGFFLNDDILEIMKIDIKLISKLPYEAFEDEYLYDEIIKIIKPEWYNYLPPCIANVPEIQKKCNKEGCLTIEQMDAVCNGHYQKIVELDCFHPTKKFNTLKLISKRNSGELIKKYYRMGIFSINEAIEIIKSDFTFIKGLPEKIIKDKYFIEKIVELVQPEWYDCLPQNIASLPEVKKKCNKWKEKVIKEIRDTQGYTKDWIDKNGNLREFFQLKGNCIIKTKEDYLVIYKRYIKDKLTIEKFCEKYGINYTCGFSKFLRKLELENDEYNRNISNTKEEVKNSTEKNIKNIINKIVSNKLTIEEFLNVYKNDLDLFNVKKIFALTTKNEANILAHKFIEYFDKNKILINKNFVDFFTVDPYKVSNGYARYINKNLFLPGEKDLQEKCNEHIKILKRNERYCRNNIYCIFERDGERYVVDDSVIDQAYAYLKDHEYQISNSSINYMCIEIAMRKFDYSQELENNKDKMIDSIIDLTLEELTIEEYLNYMENKSKQLIK